MKFRYTSEKDYPELVSWWKWFRFPVPTIVMLPNNMEDGIMISTDDGVNMCAGFIYVTPSVIFWTEYIVSNPEIKDKDLRKESLELLINTIGDLARKMGAKALFTSVKNENLINRNLACGYTSSPSVEMVKIL